MELLNKLTALQDKYNEINKYNKILKDGSHIYLLKKLKSDFEVIKLKYKDITLKIEDLKNRLIEISGEVNKHKHLLQEKEEFLSNEEEKDWKIVESTYVMVKEIKELLKSVEDESLILMEEEEKLEIEKEKLRLELVNIKNNFNIKKEEINNDISLAHERTEELKKEIIEERKDIPQDALKKFDELIDSKDTAVVSLQGGMCLGCRMKVSAMVIDSIRKGEELVYCNNCDRILNHNSSYLKIIK